MPVEVEKDANLVLGLDFSDGGPLAYRPSHGCIEIVHRDVEMLGGVLSVGSAWPHRPGEVLFVLEVQDGPGRTVAVGKMIPADTSLPGSRIRRQQRTTPAPLRRTDRRLM